MRVEAIHPDSPLVSSAQGNRVGGTDFERVLDALANVLGGANRAEDAFASGSGTLEGAVYERARADVALAVATSTAQRVAQSVQTILNMQV